jgi:hypothetical protein
MQVNITLRDAVQERIFGVAESKISGEIYVVRDNNNVFYMFPLRNVIKIEERP